jgi:hypothetical protein
MLKLFKKNAETEDTEKLFELPDKKTQSRLASLIKDTHREIINYRNFVPAPYGGDEEKEFAFYKLKDKHEGGFIYNHSRPWLLNSFYIAEEYILYSSTAQKQEPRTIAALTRLDFKGLEEIDKEVYYPTQLDWESEDLEMQNAFFTYLAITDQLKPEDFSEIFGVHKKAATICELETKSPKSGLLSGVDFFPVTKINYREPRFNWFKNIFWIISEERQAKRTATLDCLEKMYGAENTSMYDRLSEQRRRKLKLC